MPALLEIKNVVKNYDGKTPVLDGVSLELNRGEVIVLIGPSGCGKSTLLRCINGLEAIQGGEICLEGKAIDYNKKDLTGLRQKIGMVFQSYELFPHMTILENIILAPTKVAGVNKESAKKEAMELLEKVGLAHKAKAYPRELSGGQKQRVAIARALANDPKVLLCDEATSALDPQTTASILELLQSLNKKLGITIVVITHEMAVVKQICDRVAVMENGNVVEEGDVFSIFANPKHQITKDFIKTTSNLQKIEGLIASGSDVVKLSPGEVILRLSYKKANTSEALISEVSRKFNINLNIIYADVEIVKGAPIGGTVAIVSGQKADIDAAIKHLHDKEVGVEVIKDERIFTHSLTKHIG